ncbi:hypothetical protein FB45DRAFT_301439 [Roridomyces roridus]|uniref:Uncharacterized protein n=1 Tax=Roridomyces roridus TaxID=1738132 RepID=A0AAD7FVC9_9AGAR|nr:hypothetical protein FB45DRAFT_301439 [Roridomyces roridus]
MRPFGSRLSLFRLSPFPGLVPAHPLPVLTPHDAEGFGQASRIRLHSFDRISHACCFFWSAATRARYKLTRPVRQVVEIQPQLRRPSRDSLRRGHGHIRGCAS